MFNYLKKVKQPIHCSPHVSRNSTGWGHVVKKTNPRPLVNKHIASCNSFLTLDVELAKTKKVLEVYDQYQPGMAVLALLNMSTSITVAKLTTVATANAT